MASGALHPNDQQRAFAPAPQHHHVIQPPRAAQSAHAHVPPQHVQGSQRLVDNTPRKVLTEEECRTNMTTYEAWTIRKADPPGHAGQTWARTQQTKEAFSQSDIIKHIKELRAKGPNVVRKQEQLFANQKTTITQLLDGLKTNERDPTQFELTLADLERNIAPVKHRGTGAKKEKETTSIVLFVKRAPRSDCTALSIHHQQQQAKAQQAANQQQMQAMREQQQQIHMQQQQQQQQLQHQQQLQNQQYQVQHQQPQQPLQPQQHQQHQQQQHQQHQPQVIQYGRPDHQADLSKHKAKPPIIHAAPHHNNKLRGRRGKEIKIVDSDTDSSSDYSDFDSDGDSHFTSDTANTEATSSVSSHGGHRRKGFGRPRHIGRHHEKIYYNTDPPRRDQSHHRDHSAHRRRHHSPAPGISPPRDAISPYATDPRSPYVPAVPRATANVFDQAFLASRRVTAYDAAREAERDVERDASISRMARAMALREVDVRLPLRHDDRYGRPDERYPVDDYRGELRRDDVRREDFRQEEVRREVQLQLQRDAQRRREDGRRLHEEEARLAEEDRFRMLEAERRRAEDARVARDLEELRMREGEREREAKAHIRYREARDEYGDYPSGFGGRTRWRA